MNDMTAMCVVSVFRDAEQGRCTEERMEWAKQMMVKLRDGTEADSCSEAWRKECEARYVVAMKSMAQRREYLDDIDKKRGRLAGDELRREVAALWAVRKAA